jgi:hypothetical protein
MSARWLTPGSARALACRARRLAEQLWVSGEGAENSTRGACAPQPRIA